LKRVMVDEHLDEMEVHPPGLYQHLVNACVDSAKDLLDQRERFVETACPACASPDRKLAFEKHGYTYWSCQVCATLFVSPRPSSSLLDWYLLHSPAAAFRGSDEYREAMGRRVKELAAHRAEWVSELCERVRPDGRRSVVDVQTRSPDSLAQLQRRQVGPLIAVKPLCSLPESLTMPSKSLTTVDDLTDLRDANARLIALFDVLERETSPSDLVLAAHEALGPGGLLVITARSGSGFDVQVLWEHSTIFPLEHINLLSVEGMRTLLTRAGFEILEASTPGQLDVQMIERVLQEQIDADAPRFLKYFLKQRDIYTKRRLQQFLQENLLSSHLRVVARKASESEW
jgi:hypothetical protein